MKPTTGMNSTQMYPPLFPMSCILLNINEIEGISSKIQKMQKTIIIVILNGFNTSCKHVKLTTKSISRRTIIIELAKTPHQNSLREDLPEKSKALCQNKLNPLPSAILVFSPVIFIIYLYSLLTKTYPKAFGPQ